ILQRDENEMSLDVREELEKIYAYAKSKDLEDLANEYFLDEKQINYVNKIVEKEETFKGVYTVLLSSLIYKYFNPMQDVRSEEHTSELQSRFDLVCRLLLEKKKIITKSYQSISVLIH